MKDQQYPKFLRGKIRSLVYRPLRSTALVLGGSLLVLVIIIIMIGGLLFWMPKISYVFMDRSVSNAQSELSELESAMYRLQMMRRMLGDEQVWSQSIQAEYGSLLKAQLIKTRPKEYGYINEFAESK